MANVRMYTEEQTREYRNQLSQMTDAEILKIRCKRTGKPGTANDWLLKCGVRYFERDGKMKGLRDIRTAEAHELLLKIAKEARVVASVPADTVADLGTVETIKTTDAETIANMVKEQLTGLREAKDGSTVPYTEGCEAIVALSAAQSIMRALPDHYIPSANGAVRQSRYSSRLNLRGAVMKVLENWAKALESGDTPRNYRIAATVPQFKRFFYQAFAADIVEKQETAEQRLEERHEGKANVRIQGLREWAQTIATNFNESWQPSRWKDVVLALAFLTGRRSYSELMSTASFELLNETTVRFRGQAKGKGTKDEDYTLDIPVFADASIVCNMLKWLETVERKVSGKLRTKEENAGKVANDEDARKLAHKRWSKELTEYFKAKVKPLIAVDGELAPNKDISIHSLRALYAKEYARVYHPESQFVTLNLRSILGHEDADTTNRYEVDFNVVD